MIVHFAADYFHYDNKFWRTLRALFLKPGLATLEFNQGKRAKYLNPIQLYIFVTTVFFIALFAGQSKSTQPKKEKSENVSSALTKKGRDSLLNKGVVNTDGEVHVGINLSDPSLPTVEAYDSLQRTLPEEKRDGFVRRYLTHKTYTFDQKYPDAGSFNKELTYRLKQGAPKTFFLLLPYFAFLLWLVFIRKKAWFIDHLVFSLHFHSVLFIAVGLCGLLMVLFDNDYADVLLFMLFCAGMSIHLFFSLKRVYGGSGIRILLKQFFVFLLYLSGFILVMLLLVFYSFINM